MHHEYWLGGRSLHEMFDGILPGLDHMRMIGSKISAWVPPEDASSWLTKGGRARMSGMHTMRRCASHWTNPPFGCSTVGVRTCENDWASQLIVLDDGWLIHHCLDLLQPFKDVMPVDDKEHLMTHAAWYDKDNKIISILLVSTTAHPIGDKMYTHVHLMEHVCVSACVGAWDSLARFAAYGGRGCTVISYHPLMSMTHTITSEDGELDERIIMSLDAIKCMYSSDMYWVMYKLVIVHTLATGIALNRLHKCGFWSMGKL